MFSFFCIILAIIGFSLFKNNETKSAEVLDDAWDEYGLLSYHIGESDPTI